jgi:hypothetical protein
LNPPANEASALAGSNSTRGPACEVAADAEQVQAGHARYLLELAGVYTRQALAFPDEVAMLRHVVEELLFEHAALRYQLDQLAGRVESLERRARSGGQ